MRRRGGGLEEVLRFYVLDVDSGRALMLSAALAAVVAIAARSRRPVG